MEGKGNITDDLLLDYLDGLLSVEENQVIELQITQSNELAERFHHLQVMDKQLKKLTLATPPDSFATKVMVDLTSSIYEMDRKSRLNGLLILVAGILTVLIGAIFISQGLNDISFSQYLTTTPISDLLEAPVKEVSIVFNMGIITQVLLFVLGILSLLILDKVVLKPHFKNRRAQFGY